MEVLTACLEKFTAAEDFKHHWRTKETALTHITFADDVLLFCKDEVESAKLLMDVGWFKSFLFYLGIETKSAEK